MVGYIPPREDPKVFLDKLGQHEGSGHEVVVAKYGNGANLALECVPCATIITDSGDDGYTLDDVLSYEDWAEVARLGDVDLNRAIIGLT